MRYLKLLVLLLVSFSGFAQAPTNYTNINGRYRWIAGMFDSTFSLPKGATPSLRTGGSTNGGALFYRTTDSTVRYWTGSQWLTVADTSRFIPYTGATQNTDLGQYGIKTKWVEFDTSTQAVTARRLQWSNDDGVLQYGMTNGATMTNRIGLEQFARVKNVDATQINKGEVVYLFGASGDRAAVKKADNRQDATSSKTLGVATEDIPVDSVGFVGTFGVVGKLNLAAFTPGDILYLDSIPGQLTKTKPQAPYHLVFIGVVERANAGNGLLFVNPQNGYELEELHNVRITSPVLNKSILAYDSVRALWVDTTFSALGGVVTQVNTGTGLTGGPITGVGTIAADTLLLSTRAWRQKGIDSVQANLTAGLATKLNISDTASMLSPYARTNVVNAGLALKVNISDTASMLSPYARTNAVNAGLATKVNISDTASMLTPYLRSNVAAATYVPQTRTITINGTSQDLSANRTYNVGTVTQVSSGVGLSGGPITTSGTLSVDTLLMSTRAWRQKGIDSVAALANSKVSSVSGIAPISSTGGTTPSIQISLANTTTDGYLSSTDWNTFNSKIGGSGTLNYFPRFSASGTIANSTITTNSDGGTITFNGGTNPDGPSLNFKAGSSVTVSGAGFNSLGFTTQTTSDYLVLATSNLKTALFDFTSITANTSKTYTLPNASGTIALTSNIPTVSGTTNYIPKFTGSSAIGNSNLQTDASGNLGLGVTPSAWYSTYKAIQLGTKGAAISGRDDGNDVDISSNAYRNTSAVWTYSASDYAARYFIANGAHTWYNAPSGTAGNAITFTQAMTLDASGNLGLGTTSPSTYGGQLVVNGTANSAGITTVVRNQTDVGGDNTRYAGIDFMVGSDNGTSSIRSYRTNSAGDYQTALTFWTKGAGAGPTSPTERMRITSGGTLQLNAQSTYGSMTYEPSLTYTKAGQTGVGGIYFGNSYNSNNNIGMQLRVSNDGTQVQAVTITSGGNVGIGTSSPDAGVLQLNKATNSQIAIVNTNVNTGWIGMVSSDLVIAKEANNNIIFKTNSTYPDGVSTGDERMRITGGGEVYIAGTTDQGAYNLQVNGTGVWGAGAYVNGSDIRLKENIKEVGSALSLVNQLKPKTYTYKSSYSSDTATQVGFIAQDLEEVLKNEVYKNSIVVEGKEYKSVAYQNLIPLLVKAIQEQQIEIEKLKKQIK